MNKRFIPSLCFLCISMGSFIGILWGMYYEEDRYRKMAYDNKVAEDYIGYDHHAYFRMKTDKDILREHGCLDK